MFSLLHMHEGTLCMKIWVLMYFSVRDIHFPQNFSNITFQAHFFTLEMFIQVAHILKKKIGDIRGKSMKTPWVHFFPSVSHFYSLISPPLYPFFSLCPIGARGKNHYIKHIKRALFFKRKEAEDKKEFPKLSRKCYSKKAFKDILNIHSFILCAPLSGYNMFR